jgi:putative oxidoreductase
LCLIWQGGGLQRLYSMFPNGWPGRGLLLLRLVAGAILVLDGMTGLTGASHRESVTPQVIAAIAGIFLLAGLWTPIAGALVTLTELWIAFAGTAHLRSAILLATMGVSLAVLGPGARSIDARLFGRKRLDIGRNSGTDGTDPNV